MNSCFMLGVIIYHLILFSVCSGLSIVPAVSWLLLPFDIALSDFFFWRKALPYSLMLEDAQGSSCILPFQAYEQGPLVHCIGKWF